MNFFKEINLLLNQNYEDFIIHSRILYNQNGKSTVLKLYNQKYEYVAVQK